MAGATKEPVNLRNGHLAKTDNPQTWVPFDIAIERNKGYGCDGIGLCRTGDQIFIDLDGVFDSNGNPLLFDWGTKILGAVPGRAYIEKSATGTGIHAICRGTLPTGRRQFDEPKLVHTGFAFYDDSRFFTFTGQLLPGSGSICDLTADLRISTASCSRSGRHPEAARRDHPQQFSRPTMS